ncbi:MAG: hypothetical protein ABIH42_07420 [Planctomycetota bacterium]
MLEKICKNSIFVLLAVWFLSSCSSAPRTTDEGDSKLCWKKEKGTKLFYDYYEKTEGEEQKSGSTLTITWSTDKAAVSVDGEMVIMDKYGGFFSAENLSSPPDKRIQFLLETFFPLPASEITTGDSWTKEITTKQEGDKKFSGKITATLLELKKERVKDYAVIEIDAEFSVSMDTQEVSFSSVKKLSGTTLFDISYGHFLKGEFNGEIVSTSTLKPEDEKTLPLEQKTSGKFSAGYLLVRDK